MNTEVNYKEFWKESKILILEKKTFPECGVTIETTVEYCETPKGPHFIATFLHSGEFIQNPDIEGSFKYPDNVVLDILKQNAEIHPTLTVVYDTTALKNVEVLYSIPLAMKINKWSTEFNKVAIPLGYKNLLAIADSSPQIKVLNKISTMFPSAYKPKTLYLKSLVDAESTLHLIRTYGVL